MSAFLVTLLQLISWIFIARALISWFRIRPDSPFYPVVDLLERITEPVLSPVRSVLPRTGMFDFSILVVILGINLFLIPLAISLG